MRAKVIVFDGTKNAEFALESASWVLTVGMIGDDGNVERAQTI
jgi:hypothetical protein